MHNTNDTNDLRAVFPTRSTVRRLPPGSFRGAWPNCALAILLVGALFLTVLPGCGETERDRLPPDQQPPEVTTGGTLRVLHEYVSDLDPRVVDDIYESTVTNQMFEGLVRYDPSLGIAPSLAESWIVSEDGLHYTFQLRHGLTFHDGSRLDAPGVVASLERVLAPERPGECIAETYLLQIRGAREYREGLAPHVVGLSAPDEYTISIELGEALSFFLAVLAMDQTRIVPGTMSMGGDDPPVGTGPFEFVGRRVDGDREEIVLRRNDRYWGEPSSLDTLIFVCNPEETPNDEEKIRLLLAGEVDGIGIRSALTSRLAGLGYRITAAPELSINFLGFQTSKPPLDDVRVRQAIAHCLDHESFADLEDAETLPATGILPPGIPGYLPSSRILPFDLASAAELLASAGYGPENPTCPLTLYTSGTGRSYEFFKGPFCDSLREIGIPIQVEVVGWVELDQRLRSGTAPLFLVGWVADVPDADGFLYALFHSTASNNLFDFCGPDVDRGLEDARHMTQGEDRIERYREIESQVLEAAPMVPLYHELNCFAWNPGVTGVDLGPYGLPSVRFSLVRRQPGGRGVPGLAEGSQ